MHLLQEEGAGAREASAAAGHADVAVALPLATALKLRVTDEMLPAYLEPLTYDVAPTDGGDADGGGDGEGEDGGLSEVELGERRGSLRALHSERLRAVVVVTSTDLQLSSLHGSRLLAACALAPELQFEPLQEQLAAVREQCAESGCPLLTGDFFATKHSNLRRAHVVYHIAISPADLQPGSLSEQRRVCSLLAAGMRNAVSHAARAAVEHVVLPASLRVAGVSIDDADEGMTYRENAGARHALMLAVRGALQENVGCGAPLAVVEFVTGRLGEQAGEEFFCECKDSVSSIFANVIA